MGKQLDKKTEVNFKDVTLQTGKQTVVIHIFPIISRSTGNQAINLDHVKYSSSKIMQRMRREASSRPLFAFLKKALCEVESNGEHLSVNIFWYNSTWAYNKNKL